VVEVLSGLWLLAIRDHSTGVVPLLFVSPLEMPRVGPSLGGAAVGMALTAGFLGGSIMPLIGMALGGRDPLMASAFWGTCIAAAGLLFLTLPETGPRSRRGVERMP